MAEAVPLLSLSEGASKDRIWTYERYGTPGAVRLFNVDKLLSNETPSIDLFEWRDLFASSDFVVGRPQSLPTNVPRYAAISHVWAQTQEVHRIASEVNRPLSIRIDEPEPHVISWHGLIQCATAARALGCDYLWLDLLCLNQLSKEDKNLQIKNMGRIYGHSSAVLVMFGGVSAAQGIEHVSSWIDRAWTLQEATLCADVWGVIDWSRVPDPTASFSLSNTIITEKATYYMRRYTTFTALSDGIAIIPLRALLRFGPGQRLGSGHLGSKATELKIPINCLGRQPNAISVLSMAINAMWPRDETKSHSTPGRRRRRNSIIPTGDRLDYTEGGKPFSADYTSDPERSSEDANPDEFFSGFDKSTEEEKPYPTKKGVNNFMEEYPELKSEEDRTDLRHLSAWRSMWLRTSTKPQDMVFSMMHILNADIEVDYKRNLEDLLFELVQKTRNPIWLLIGNRLPVIPNSGILPVLPDFTPNSLPTIKIDGRIIPTGAVVSLDVGCSNIDVDISYTSIAEGHDICARFFNVVEWAPIPQGPSRGGRQDTEFDLKLTSRAYNVMATCMVDGSIGPIMLLIGEWNTPFKNQTWRYYRKGFHSFVYFFDQSKDKEWKKCGVGILRLSLFKKFWSHKLQRIGRSHLHVGSIAIPGAEASLLPCNCGADDSAMNEEDVITALSHKSKEELSEELLRASTEGDEADVRLLIKAGADVNYQSEIGDFALQAACHRNERHMLIALLEGGADPNLRGGEYGTALQAAVSDNSEHIVLLLLSRGADVNSSGGTYGSPLRAACSLGYQSMVQLLIKNGADIHFTGSKRGHALKDAIHSGHLSLVKYLLDCGIDVNTVFHDPAYKGRSISGNINRCVTALQTACYERQREIVRFLIEKGANVNAQGGFFGDALTVAVRQGDMLLVELLVKNGANINSRCEGSYYGNPLQAACTSRYGRIGQAAMYLIKMGADVNATGGYFGTALQAAAYWYQTNTVQALIASGADVNARAGKYGTALQAVNKYHGYIARMLIENGADTNVDEKYAKRLRVTLKRTYEGVVRMRLEKGAEVNETDARLGSVLQAAALGAYVEVVVMLGGRKHLGKFDKELVSQWEHEEVIRLLLKSGANVNLKGGEYHDALQAACIHGNVNVVTTLVAHGADVNSFGGYYGTALQAASRHGFRKIMTYLLKNGANANTVGGQYHSAFHAAVNFGNEDIVELLRNHGGDIHVTDIQGRNLLHLAASTGNIAMINYLQKHGVDVHALDHQGRSCLHHAASAGSLPAIDLLLGVITDVKLGDRNGWTPLHWAARNGEEAMVHRLLVAGADKLSLTDDGWTPLKVAVFHGNLSLKSLLSASVEQVDGKDVIRPVFFTADSSADANEVGYLHRNIRCDGCGMIVYGTRFRCKTCSNFDYCFKCHKSAELTHADHIFEAIDQVKEDQELELGNDERSDESEKDDGPPKEGGRAVHYIY